jgi:flagellar biosynthesis chaperone FliJ
MAVKTLQTLIKLYKRRVDVIRREMMELEEQQKQLKLAAEMLEKEYQREMELAAESPLTASFFGDYSRHVKKRQEVISQEINRLDKVILEKAEAIRLEYTEQKKFEIANEHAKKRLLEDIKHKQQQRFDEIASQQYYRKQEDPL